MKKKQLKKKIALLKRRERMAKHAIKELWSNVERLEEENRNAYWSESARRTLETERDDAYEKVCRFVAKNNALLQENEQLRKIQQADEANKNAYAVEIKRMKKECADLRTINVELLQEKIDATESRGYSTEQVERDTCGSRNPRGILNWKAWALPFMRRKRQI